METKGSIAHHPPNMGRENQASTPCQSGEGRWSSEIARTTWQLSRIALDFAPAVSPRTPVAVNLAREERNLRLACPCDRPPHGS